MSSSFKVRLVFHVSFSLLIFINKLIIAFDAIKYKIKKESVINIENLNKNVFGPLVVQILISLSLLGKIF